MVWMIPCSVDLTVAWARWLRPNYCMKRAGLGRPLSQGRDTHSATGRVAHPRLGPAAYAESLCGIESPFTSERRGGSTRGRANTAFAYFKSARTEQMNPNLVRCSVVRRLAGAVTVAATIVAASILITTCPSVMTAQTSEDSATVRAQVEAYLTTWNAHDPSALAAFFTEGADMIMYNQPASQGRTEIQAWWRDYFARQEPQRQLTIAVNSLRLISADAAVIDIATTTGGGDAQGEELHTRKARGTWVLVRQRGEWVIAAMRGMPTEQDRVILTESLKVVEAENPSDVPSDLRDFVAAYENAYNSNDPSALSGFYTRDADIIVRNLPATRGWQAIQDWWRAYFTGREPRATFPIDAVRLITPDVALIDVLAASPPQNAKGEEMPARQARGTWVVVSREGRWLITALRVLPGEQDRIVR
jgi:uncharacterized protein (TIGR02246 family)